MKFNNLYFEPYKDIYNYHKIIKTIKSGFRLFFNKKDKLFSVVNIFKNNEICFSFYDISKINLNDLRFSLIENCIKVLNTIDKYNSNLIEKQTKNNREILNFSLKEIVNLSNRSNSVKQQDIDNIIGETIC